MRVIQFKFCIALLIGKNIIDMKMSAIFAQPLTGLCFSIKVRTRKMVNYTCER